ncbi:MAG: alpha-hydroxy-acid oxidizing protein [Lachnospiraceae bacterium]|nr:alpha-hydroxy-acid oxidizing protein [Lachnospiraceae bacterium]
MSDIGNSNRISREYIDSLLIETRYMDSTNPDYSFELYGESFSSPVMTAALSHLEHRLGKEAPEALANGAKEAGCVLWYGMAEDEEIERLAKTGARMIEIIKPYTDRDIIWRKLEQAEKLGLLAVGIDIDHPFGNDGSPDVIDDIYEMTALTTAELMEICKKTKLPVIIKGVLSLRDAERSLAAGARGLVLSHHNNRIEYAVPPLFVLPEIAELVNGDIPIFVDCEIQTGMDVFKALALGATGACIGRPLMAAIKENGAEGVKNYLLKVSGELGKAMAFTGCYNLEKMDPTVIRRI